jgi:electron transport complex protein RnfD
MRFKTVTSPHATAPNRTGRVMADVVLALLPGTAAMVWFFGWGVLINILLAVVTAWLCESAMLIMRGRPVLHTLADNSAVVTAWLLALCLPPLAPWWLTVIGVSFAIIFAKHLYGGLGSNLFNPAMAGYVVLLISFPLEMTQWLPPRMLTDEPLGFMQSAQAILFNQLPAGGWDAIGGATPLDKVKTELGMMKTMSEIKQSPLFGDFGARGWEWVGNWYLLGGVYLLFRRVITWHTPVTMLGGLFAAALFFYMVDPGSHPSPMFHVFSGGAILGAFFIATDPVSSCTSNKGKLVYGAGIGVLVYILRSWAGYPDGVAFAVLLMNMAAPFIDHYTKPRTFGQARS